MKNGMKNVLANKCLAPFEKISTKLPKIYTLPYCNSEFHTIHDLENGKLNSILFQVFHTEYEPWNNPLTVAPGLSGKHPLIFSLKSIIADSQ